MASSNTVISGLDAAEDVVFDFLIFSQGHCCVECAVTEREFEEMASSIIGLTKEAAKDRLADWPVGE